MVEEEDAGSGDGERVDGQPGQQHVTMWRRY